MKKVFLSTALILALSISFVSCKKTKDAAADAADATEEVAEEAVAEVTEAVEEATEAVEEAATGVPSFEDPKVQEYVDAYEAYIAEYAKAAESKDMTAFASLGTKGQELGTKAQEVLTGLSPEDAQKLTDYMTEKSKTLQELAAKMTAQ